MWGNVSGDQALGLVLAWGGWNSEVAQVPLPPAVRAQHSLQD